jgi:ring-1,2-phenylacetyl-CoA epoxidase subunit PaaC
VSRPLQSLVLTLADDELVIGHRHSEWTGFAPHLEEDVAFSSIAQDEIGHAAALYALFSRAAGEDPDGLALGREPHEYRNAVLCERPNGDWSYTLARHWLYDSADEVRLEALEESSDPDLAALAIKMRREERYHLLHADAWLKRIGHGPVEGRAKLIEGLAHALAEADGIFEPIDDEDQAVYQGLLPVPLSELRRRFLAVVTRRLDELGLPTDIGAPLDESAEFVASSSGDLIASAAAPPGGAEGAVRTREEPAGRGGRYGRHTGDFEQLWGEMTSTYRSSPGASW